MGITMQDYAPNTYHRISAPKRVWIQTGSVPGNHYFGNSRIYDVVGQEVTLSPGDEIHNLVGGLFAITNLGTFKILLKSPDKLNMHFCKDYTDRSWYVNQILSEQCYEVSKATARIPASYNV
jgi:hypothetical protein